MQEEDPQLLASAAWWNRNGVHDMVESLKGRSKKGALVSFGHMGSHAKPMSSQSTKWLCVSVQTQGLGGDPCPNPGAGAASAMPHTSLSPRTSLL